MCNLTRDFDSIYVGFFELFWFAGLLSVSCYALVTWVSEFQIMCHSSSHEVSCVHFFVITRGVHQNKIIKLLYSLRWELKKAVDCFIVFSSS